MLSRKIFSEIEIRAFMEDLHLSRVAWLNCLVVSMILRSAYSTDKNFLPFFHFFEQSKKYCQEKIASIYFIKLCFKKSENLKVVFLFNFLG